jgi:hypothetical protein
MEFVWDSRTPTPQQQQHDEDSRPDHRRRLEKLSLENCNNTLCFLEDFRVLVCKQHCTAVVNLNTHLREQQATPAKLRGRIIEHFSRYDVTELKDVKLLEQPADLIEELGLPLHGLKCKTCDFITVNINVMRTHCKRIHEQAWIGNTSLLYDCVKVQTFFRTGDLQKYFVVNLGEVEDEENLGDERRLERRLAEFRLTQELVKEDLQVLEDAAKTDRTGWYKRTGWISFLKDRNLTLLAHQLRTPDLSEYKIKLAAELTERLIERCVRGLATLPQEIRRWLRSAKREAPDTRLLG